MSVKYFIPAGLHPGLQRMRLGLGQWLALLDRRELSLAAFETLLARHGVLADATVMVHSSMNALGRRVEGLTPIKLIELLQRKLGPGGTLLMPTFPFMGYQRDYAQRQRCFDASRTPSRMGLLTEVFRRLPNTHRSLHPTHAVSAWGKHAAALVRDHHRGTAFGRHSPFYKLQEYAGRVIGLGVSPVVFTLFHTAEELHPVTRAYNYDDSKIAMELRAKEGNFSYDMSPLRTDRVRDYRPVARILKRAGVLSVEKINGFTACSADAAIFLQHTLKLIESGQFQKIPRNS